ncbi:DUF2157 domain-containing protein [Delftia acidovorans]|uniref:DUF2157 domain-containing protein n=1 Tax=Delftia acidovorans TaxID=80866 RepID=UPI000BD2D870|nr:DUF2157 domain-containing protein [Delftia acidovorans]SOE37282.1 Predicted membrane protein [Delftia acidovorans]
MNLRPLLHDLVRQHGLDRKAAVQLFALAGFEQEPAALRTRLWPVVALLGAALGGLGIVLWIAANWESMGRMQRFALLQGFVLVMCLGAAWRAAARVPLSVLALLGTGALFAFFGQTYQTGADPWQLFALWAALTLPLALAARSDGVWVPWVVVAMTGIALWAQAHTPQFWEVESRDLGVHAVALSAALAVTAVMAPALRRFTGAGLWALRGAGALALAMITSTAISGLFHSTVAPQYPLGLVLLAGAAALAGLRRHFDIFLLSGAAMGLNVLLVCGLVYLLLEKLGADFTGMLLLVGLGAACLLAATVSLVLRMSRNAEGGLQ